MIREPELWNALPVPALVIAADVARSTYDRWVAGKNDPNLGSLGKVRDALDRLEAGVSGDAASAPAPEEDAA